MTRKWGVRIWIPVVAGVLVAIALGVVLVSTGSEDSTGSENPLAACVEQLASADPDAAATEAEGTEPEAEGGESEAVDPDKASGPCALRRSPESFAELADANNAVAQRVSADSTADYEAAARQRTQLASADAPTVRGAGGRWQPVGRGPLHADDPDYPGTYGEGFAELAGRVSDYAYDRQHHRVYAAVASGGVWRSRDQGKTWRSIGDSLPTQTVGSVAYSPAAGGTLIAVTGDNAFGGNTYGGLGVFRSTNEGRTWQRAKGPPSGAQGFKAAVDPTDPRVIYAATGAGLFRSTNDGRSYRNVVLPTGKRCQGNTFTKANCFFANVVTDVAVQAPDHFGNKGGTVLAAVGWRDGRRENFNGVPEAPANGLYRSTTGRPGTFNRLEAGGFTPDRRVGRVELGAATGPAQDHGYIYAVVQDAVLFNKGTVEGLDVPNGNAFGFTPTATPTYLNGIYVSSDFGRTWKQMADDNQMLSPTSGSVLAQLTPLGFGPGIQSWYDEWIRPDPTKQIGGVPTRLVFGLEELFENREPVPQNGQSEFKAIGPYNANGGACLLVIASEACSKGQGANPNNTTTHPDQHAGIFIPDGKGGVTLLAGNDGGNYRQHVRNGVGPNSDFTHQGFGKGAQDGFHTLLPYGVAASSDGVVYAGLQDNGEIRIAPNGRQTEVFGGDGVFTQVHPSHSRIAYEELPEAGINVTSDGGKSWRDMSPFVDNASFYAPLVMDPANPKHLLSGGRQIVETTSGPQTGSSSDKDWKEVFDLGKSKLGVENQVSAFGVSGKRVYAGYCGGCDPVRDHVKFFAGLATNVGGKKPPKAGTSNGWHKVPAEGLPKRFISNVTIDPRNPRVVYVTLGASSLRPYAPPNSTGASGESAGGGHVYKSTDGGRTFRNISGNLQRIPALWSVVRGGQLIVATTVGVFISNGTSGGHYALLGRNLPPAPVFSMQRVPGHPRQLVVASLGRGVYRYTFPRGQ